VKKFNIKSSNPPLNQSTALSIGISTWIDSGGTVILGYQKFEKSASIVISTETFFKAISI